MPIRALAITNPCMPDTGTEIRLRDESSTKDSCLKTWIPPGKLLALLLRLAVGFAPFALTSFAPSSFDALWRRRTLRAALSTTSALTASSLDVLSRLG